MRAVLLFVLVVAGCGKPAAVPGEKGKPDDKVVIAPSGPPVKYTGDYNTGNPVAADLKYKGKLVSFQRVEIDKVARTKDGRAYAAPLSALVVGAVPEPCYFFFMSDEEAAKITPGKPYDITGQCLGYEKDTLWRGRIPGMDWHVDFVNCTVAEPPPAPLPPKKK